DLPLRASATALAQEAAHFFDRVVDVLGAQSLPLHRVPGLPAPEAEGVAVGLDPLVTRTKRAEGVRILGDLAQHGRKLPCGPRRRGREVRQRPAKPCTAVRVRSAPSSTIPRHAPQARLIFFVADEICANAGRSTSCCAAVAMSPRATDFFALPKSAA